MLDLAAEHIRLMGSVDGKRKRQRARDRLVDGIREADITRVMEYGATEGKDGVILLTGLTLLLEAKRKRRTTKRS